MDTVTLVPLPDYLNSTYEVPSEYVDGVLMEKPMPTWMHARLQVWIASLILQRFPHYAVGTELRNRLKESEFRLPDISVDFLDRARNRSYAEEPIFLAVEILSEGDRLGETFVKCERYHDWGVAHCWVVDALHRSIWSYSKGSEPLRVADAVQAGDIHLDLADIFGILDR
jgi:Uma2 family endonuclease